MKRSFALIGFTYLIALMAAIYFGEQISFFVSIGLIVCFVISLFFKDIRKKKAIPVALFVAAAGFLVYSMAYNNEIYPVDSLKEKDVEISGVICEMPYKEYNRYYYILETDYISMENAEQKVKLKVSSSEALEADAYDRVTANVHIYEPSSGNGYNSKIYYQARGIFLFAYLDEYKKINVEKTNNKPLYYYVIKAREKMLSAFRIMLPTNEASMVSGILLGDKRNIPEEIKSDFRDVGVSHMLAVSGMHLSILSQFLMMSLAYLNVPKQFRSTVVSLCIFAFMALMGFSYPVMRAGIMSMIYFIGLIFGRKSDSLNSLGAAVFIICLINPFSAADIGLLLSFSAVLGILLLQKPINKFIKDRITDPKKENHILNWAITTFSISLASTVFTSPIIMLIFKRISIIAPIANVIIIFPMAFMMVCAFLSLLLYLLHISFIAITFAALAGIAVDYMIYAAHLLSMIPWASLPTNQGFILIWIAATFVLIAIAILLRNDARLIRFAAILSSIILFVGIFSYQICRRNVVSIAVLDTGNGLSVVLNRDNHTALISSGGEKYYQGIVSDYLDSLNTKKLDYFLVSNSCDEASLYADSILSEYPAYSLSLCNNTNVHEKVAERNTRLCDNVNYFNKCTTVDMWGNVKLYVKNIENESYVYFEVNKVSFLLSFENFNTDNLPDKWRNPNFLISSSNIDSLENVNSNFIILSKDSDSSTRVMSTLAPKNPNIIATASDGSIVIDCIKENYIDIRREY